ncbi:MAG: hypothetical protein V3V33_04610 [Candidatus Lokiarchaeia archaeon]
MSELEVMKKEGKNNIKWLGFFLSKKRAIYLRVFSSIVSSFFTMTLISSPWVLLYNNTTVYPSDKLTYFYISLLVLSNFIASSIVLWICIYTFKKTRIFRKSLKVK